MVGWSGIISERPWGALGAGLVLRLLRLLLSPPCCYCCCRLMQVRELYPCSRMLLQCPCLQRALCEWGLTSKVTNMACERLLALVKHASPERAPLVERVCAAGLLAQLLAEHARRQRPDPRVHRTSDVLRQGAPLRVGETRAAKPSMLRAHVLYANDKVSEAKRRRVARNPRPALATRGALLSRAERNAILREALQEWKELPHHQKHSYLAKASRAREQQQHQQQQQQQQQCSRQPLEKQGRPSDGTREDLEGGEVTRLARTAEPPDSESRLSGFFGQGDWEFPIAVEAVKEALLEFVQLPGCDVADLPGFTGVSPQLCKLAREASVVMDDQSIPPEHVFNYQDTCWLKYHGFCETLDAGNLRQLQKCNACLHRGVEQGSWYQVTAGLADEVWLRRCFYASLKRERDPKISVFAMAQLSGDELELSQADGFFDFRTSAMLCKELFAAGELDCVSLARLDLQGIAGSLLRARLLEVADAEDIFTTRPVPPVRGGAAPEPDAEPLDRRAAAFEAGLVALQHVSLGGRQRTARAGRSIMEARLDEESDGAGDDVRRDDEDLLAEFMPAPGLAAAPGAAAASAAVAPGTAAGKNPSATAALSAVLAPSAAVAPPAPVPVDAPRPPVPGAAARPPRRARRILWGDELGTPFALAEIVSGGEISTGYGATCHLHQDDGDPAHRTCKKTLAYGREHLSTEECQVRLKRWLLAGLRIPPGPSARTQHLAIDARVECAVGIPPADLDKALVETWAAWRAERADRWAPSVHAASCGAWQVATVRRPSRQPSGPFGTVWVRVWHGSGTSCTVYSVQYSVLSIRKESCGTGLAGVSHRVGTYLARVGQSFGTGPAHVWHGVGRGLRTASA